MATRFVGPEGHHLVHVVKTWSKRLWKKLVPELCSGTHLRETLFRVKAVARDAKRSFARAGSQTEFGNQKGKLIAKPFICRCRHQEGRPEKPLRFGSFHCA